MAALGIAFLCLALIHNERKPVGLSGSNPIWELSRPAAQALARREMGPALETIDRLVSVKATIGYVLAEDEWDYPLYGARLERRLVELPVEEPLRRARELGIDWVVVGNVAAGGSPGWVAVRFRESGWSLMAPRSSASANRLIELTR